MSSIIFQDDLPGLEGNPSYGNTWPSYLMDYSHVNAKIPLSRKRNRVDKSDGSVVEKSKIFKGIKPLRAYITEENMYEDDNDYNSG